MPLRRPGRWALAAICIWSSLAQAAPQTVAPTEALEADFLDFLGFWETEEGQGGDPFQEPPVRPSPDARNSRNRTNEEKALMNSVPRRPQTPAPVNQGSTPVKPQTTP